MYAVLKYIHNNIKEPLLASSVAKEFGFSKWYFCEQFKQYTGSTFVDYVRHYRMSLAALEVLKNEKKITDIALSYGYESVGGFNKAFLKEYGCAPSDYSKQVEESFLYYEKRRISMFQLSDRCAALRDEAVNKKNYMKQYFLQRNVYYYIGRAEAALKGECMQLCASSGTSNALNKFSPLIIPGELIVGFNYGEADCHERCFPQDKPEHIEYMRLNCIGEDDIARYFELLKQDPMPEIAPLPVFDEAETCGEKEWATVGRCIGSNHTVLGYENVLKKGFSGLLAEVEAAQAKDSENPVYESMRRVCASALTMGEKYARKAEELLQSDATGYSKKDLEKIIAVCSRVPRRPAESFIEAVQSLWFAHIVNTWEDFINANSLGRLDRILYPYYKADIEKGILTKEEAFEILCLLWIKLYRDYDVQQSCIGGTSPDGSSDVNELSYLMLDVTEQLDFIRCLSVRYSSKTEKAFLRRALEVVGHLQKGVPFFFNDDIMIPALMYKGISKEDAYGYTQIGCVETVIPGKSNPHAVSGVTNFLKALEYVMCNGHSMAYPEMAPGVKTGTLDRFETYDQFYSAVLVQIERMLDLCCSKIKKCCPFEKSLEPKPYKSLLTEGCLESGRDFNDAGAKYDYYQVMFGGVPNLADSLAVIKKFVYDDKTYTLERLKNVLENNFPDEAERLTFVNKAPKYGNDIDEVDEIAADLIDKGCDMLVRLSKKYAIEFHAQPFTYLWMLDQGHHSAASPDGRRKGETTAYSCSPMQGRDFNGLTAMLNSIAKLPGKKAPGTVSAIVEIDPKLFCDRNLDAMTDIFIAASQKGLCNVQFNIIDADTLIDAQKHPEHYNNLAVRVSGFSQKFNLLSTDLQNHIIGRTKHSCI
ncbi:MAG: helix-turn-helix domain-containing protein [Oscillospiraceae bacterium]|nr:helix-turn-helix domain-containing protein [Oscillospiraceae bacterium]